MARKRSITVRLSDEEYEWIRRKAYWDETTMAELMRDRVLYLIADEGYLRPPDDEPQDFGYEKEMMQFVLAAQNRGGVE